MLNSIFLVILYILITFLVVQVMYLLFFSIAGIFRRKTTLMPAKQLRSIRVFIPGYKEDAVIISTARKAAEHNYPSALLEIVVIADSFSETTLNKLRSLPIKVIEVNFEKSTKGKALQKAIDATSDNPVEIVVVIDADNHMAPGFLHKVNDAFEQGYEVIQGHRTAKNFETAFAFLDACTEEINNHIFRRGHVAVGLPSALIGSGMAFSWPLFVSLLKDIGDTPGEDKELEFRIVRQRKSIAFLDGAYVYDEKVSRSEVFSKQRSRWLATQVEFFEKYFIEGWIQLFKGNLAFFNKVFQTYLLPRVMLVAVVFLFVLFSVFIMPQFLLIGVCMFSVLTFSLLLGIPAKWYNRQLVQAFLQIPIALFSMIKALLQISKARKQFIHTPHGENQTIHN